MGLTCASLHALTQGPSPAKQAINLDQVVQALAERLGYERADNPEEADRELIAVPAFPWISFFDPSKPGAVTGELTHLGKQLSAVSGWLVLLTTVWDSDAFGFLLFERGKQVDGYASMRGLLPGRTRKWSPEQRAREWSRAFARSMRPEEVQAITEKGLVFADDQLVRLCGLVGLSVALATATPRDLEIQALPNRQRYYFRSRPQPGGSLLVKQTVAYKGPVLTCPLQVGQDQSSGFELNALAGSFSDPVLEFSGSAIDSGMVAVPEAHGQWSLGLEHMLAGGLRRVDAVIASAEEGRRVFRACLKGLSAARFAFPPRKKSILIFQYTLRGITAGSGEVQVDCLPNVLVSERLALRPRLLVEVR